MKIMFAVLCFVLVGCDQLKSSARYQLVGGSDGRAWKIDTTTGETWMCYVSDIYMREKKLNAACFPVEQIQ